MRFGERLRELRKQQGVSQRDLAMLVGLDFTYISKIETDDTPPPSAASIHRIALALAVDEQELIVLAGKVPDGLRSALKENPLLAALVRVLSEQRLPEEIYRQMIVLAKEAQP